MVTSDTWIGKPIPDDEQYVTPDFGSSLGGWFQDVENEKLVGL